MKTQEEIDLEAMENAALSLKDSWFTGEHYKGIFVAAARNVYKAKGLPEEDFKPLEDLPRTREGNLVAHDIATRHVLRIHTEIAAPAKTKEQYDAIDNDTNGKL